MKIRAEIAAKAAIAVILAAAGCLVVYGKMKVGPVRDKSPVWDLYYDAGYDYYSQFYDTDGLFLHNADDSLEELEKSSQYILRVKSDTPSYRYGDGMVSECTVEEVFKGNDISAGNRIVIYDLSMISMYFDGDVPLAQNENYIVFLNEAPSPNIENSYMYSSTWYGHIYDGRPEPQYTVYDIGSPEYVYSLLVYDHVFSDQTEPVIDTYTDTWHEIQEKYGSNGNG